ncbi:MAG: hypothetical protein M1297_09810 [Nitrospirae bacterium]|jgi:hypothetical protein|nr:hypothetical protein [Nitrospirota bacterium]
MALRPLPSRKILFLSAVFLLLGLFLVSSFPAFVEGEERCVIKPETGGAIRYFQSGMAFLNAHGPKKEKQRKAFLCFRQSALLGYSWGEVWLGILYYNGWGVAQDRNKALVWWKKAAEQGNPWAQDRFNQEY